MKKFKNIFSYKKNHLSIYYKNEIIEYAKSLGLWIYVDFDNPCKRLVIKSRKNPANKMDLGFVNEQVLYSYMIYGNLYLELMRITPKEIKNDHELKKLILLLNDYWNIENENH